MVLEFLLIIGVVLVIFVSILMGAKFLYVDIPQNSALLINNSKVVFSPTIILPNVKREFVHILPVHVRTEYTGNNALLCKEGLLVDVIVTYSLCVEATAESVLAVSNNIGSQFVSDKEAVAKHYANNFKEIACKVVQQFSFDTLDKDQGKLRKALSKEIQLSIKGYCLEYININRIGMTPLTGLTDQLANQQREAKFDWDIYKRDLLEHRLEQAVSQQLALSMEVKQLIDNYNKFIKKTIQDMLVRRR